LQRIQENTMADTDDKKTGMGTGAVVGGVAGGVAGGAAAGAAVGGMTGPVGAAVGAAVGAGAGALGGRAAADPDVRDAVSTDSPMSSSGMAGGISTGRMGEDRTVQTVIGAFDDTATAQRAVERLTQAGFPRDDVHLQHEQDSSDLTGQDSPTSRSTTSSTSSIPQPKKGGFFATLFGMGDYDDDDRSRQNPYAEHAYTYDEAVRRGSAVVVVDVDSESEADKASSLLHEAGAVDVDERSRQWRAEGWQPPVGGTSQSLAGDRQTLKGDQDQVLDVVEEHLDVGKRTVNRGGVRVVQRVSSRPVREVVRLREEHAVVDRRPVDRAANEQDLGNFREGTVEVRETSEEPVVAKSARVVEEVRVGKEVREREETIEDTVRRKDVEVERLEGSDRTSDRMGDRTADRMSERERAVASKDSQLDTRPTAGKDKPKL